MAFSQYDLLGLAEWCRTAPELEKERLACEAAFFGATDEAGHAVQSLEQTRYVTAVVRRQTGNAGVVLEIPVPKKRWR